MLAQVFTPGLEQKHLHTAAWMGGGVDTLPAKGPVARANAPESEHRCTRVPSDIVVELLLVQCLMHEGDGDRSLAHCRRHTLDIASPDVTDREHAGQTRFEEMRRPGKRPASGG